MTHYKILLFSILLFSVVSTRAQTIKEDRIDEEYHQCLAKDTTYTTLCNCAFVAFGKWNTEMDKTYKALLKKLKKEKDKTALKQSQKAWMTYKDAEFSTYNNIFNQPGNKWSGIRQDERIAVVKARTLQLRNYIESLNNR